MKEKIYTTKKNGMGILFLILLCYVLAVCAIIFGAMSLEKGNSAIGTLLLSLGEPDFETNFTAAVACLGNIGPGFAKVGATGNYGFYSGASKVLLSLEMLAGRLELFPIIIL